MMSRLFRLATVFTAASVLLPAVSTDAAMMNHGDFVSDTVTFSDVTENNLEASLYYNGFEAIDDTLLFDPQGLGVQVSSGPGISFLDVELTLAITANDGYALTTLDFSENGDYSVSGEAEVIAKLPYYWEIVEVDGVSISPIFGNAESSFSSSTPSNSLWNLGFSIDLEQELTLAETTVGNEIGTSVTKINLRFDNTLTADAANPLSIAFIKKKQIEGLTVGTTEFVPEPGSAFTLFLGLMGLMIRRRR